MPFQKQAPTKRTIVGSGSRNSGNGYAVFMQHASSDGNDVSVVVPCTYTRSGMPFAVEAEQTPRGN